MAPVTLEGSNLGQRHRHYNSLLKEALASNEGVMPDKISHDENDIENFLKIDIASHNRDVNYILEVLKCKDMLYVTRAIKKSRWLITDDKYSYIVNPKYLHKELFPYMMSKAKSKLVLYIRIHLRDEKRVQVFYNYYKQFDKKIATKWLQYCPLQFALQEVHNHAVDVSKSMLKRLCRKSFEFLKKYAASNHVPDWDRKEHLREVQFLVRYNVKEYLNITDSCEHYYARFFKNKYIKHIMKTCPLRILNNFFHYFYACQITFFTDIAEFNFRGFIKYMDKDSMKQLLLDSSKNQELSERIKDRNILKQFLIKIELSDRIELLKAFYSVATDINLQGPDGLNLLFSAIENNASFNIPRVFLWYQVMPFNVSFQEITKLIRKEMNADVRLSMLETLLICAGANLQDQSTLLKYYHDRHINEPHNFKESFINKFLSSVTYFNFDSEMWTILDNLFCSMEVYMNSSSSVTKCVEAIVVYKTIHDQIVPEIVEKKFNFETLKSYKNKVGVQESEKLFKYLYNSQMKNVEESVSSNEKEYCVFVESLKNTLKLLADWKKNIIDYPVLISKVRECAKIKEQHRWDIDLSTLYNIHKPWRRIFFKDSLVLYPSELVLLNALKQDQNLLDLYQTEVDLIRYHEIKFLQLVLSKLKIYWSDTLAKEWINKYLVNLNVPGKQKIAIQSLAVLQSQKDFLNIAKQHIPQEIKINWKEADEVEYFCRKYFARNIHRVRPLPGTDAVLWFANGDYLKFAVTSLNATLANISHVDREAYSSKLTNVPVSLQKHGIRMAFAKLNIENLIPTFRQIWKSTKNPTIHTTLFLNTHNLLRKQFRESRILKLWTLLQFFIDNLTESENPGIYKKMCNVGEVPGIIQSEYFMKGYNFFLTLPENLAEKYTDALITKSENTVEILDKIFIENVILGSVDDFPTKSASFVSFFARYLLCLTDKKTILTVYERRVKPLFKSDFYPCENSKELIAKLFSKLFDHISRNRTVPVTLFKTLFIDFTEKLSFPEDYVSLRMWELTCDLLEIIEQRILCEYEIINTAVLTDFGKACLKLLQKDTKLLAFPIPAFECVLRNLYFKLDFSQVHMLQIYKNMLGDQNTVESFFIVQKLLQEIVWYTEETEMRKELVEILSSHPSKEFQIVLRHYFHHYLLEVKLKSGEILPPHDLRK